MVDISLKTRIDSRFEILDLVDSQVLMCTQHILT